MNEFSDENLALVLQMINGGQFSGQHVDMVVNLKDKITGEIEKRKDETKK